MSTTPAGPTTLAEEGAAPPPGAGPEAPPPPEYVAPPDEVAEPLVDDDLDDEDDLPPGPREETEEEILEPKITPVERTLIDERGQSRKYTQRDFLYFQQFEMYGLLGRATNIVLESEGMGANDVFDMLNPRDLLDKMMSRMPGYEDAPDRADDELEGEQVGKMMAAFARVISISPDLLKEAYCIILDVPKAHRNWAMEWSLPRIDREMGNDILHTFIDQNWGILEGFFTEELPRVLKRAAQARKRHQGSSGRP